MATLKIKSVLFLACILNFKLLAQNQGQVVDDFMYTKPQNSLNEKK